ncbi:Rz-like lysis system protein LysB [Burkholderia glumae]|uniref:Rz-like lysis system protein LysB n=1 Tax=Burkholderia glumae TaxID=337 RepID=A0ABY5BH92_BURGL|nr:Rz-like lysis system protein LysB [Burkholderia glumae]MCR1771111.1 LysB family phage lysis regulatory protein [Burkholderia glumae]USS46427.1 Rz-like lysis system protein LysB [Burkholderia glumae]UVS94627.1 LysB family phage lysis regulatory protein [Burkholderia glumae]
MNVPGLRFWLALAALVAAVAGAQYVRALQGRLATAQDAARQAKRDVGSRDAIIGRLLADAREKDEQRAQLDRTRGIVDATLAAYQSQLRKLIDENEAVRTWAAARLPDDVVRLHSSPALAGADDYAQRMLDGDALHPARGASADER